MNETKLIAVPTNGTIDSDNILKELKLNKAKGFVSSSSFPPVSIYCLLENEEIVPNDYFIISTLINNGKFFYANRLHKCYAITNLEPQNGEEGTIEIWVDKEIKFTFYGGMKNYF